MKNKKLRLILTIREIILDPTFSDKLLFLCDVMEIVIQLLRTMKL